MIAHHIHDALSQVRQLQSLCLSRQQFQGYSGRARVASGLLTLLVAGLLASPLVPRTEVAHLAGWIGLMVLAILFNYVALFHWFFKDPQVDRQWYRLQPALEALGPLAVGGLLCLVMILHGQFHYLFGICMLMFGLANIASRHLMHRLTGWVGVYYLAAGAWCLLFPISFLNPWPMGIVFGFGELISGILMRWDDRKGLMEDAHA